MWIAIPAIGYFIFLGISFWYYGIGGALLWRVVAPLPLFYGAYYLHERHKEKTEFAFLAFSIFAMLCFLGWVIHSFWGVGAMSGK